MGAPEAFDQSVLPDGSIVTQCENLDERANLPATEVSRLTTVYLQVAQEPDAEVLHYRQQYGSMNFVAHAHVALRCAGSNWELAFGAALPDLASMAGTRIERSLLPPSVDKGVALHHRADSAFHALGVFQAGSGWIRTGLLGAGVPTGPARAVGHAGYELLLDGCLLGRPGVQEEFAELLARAPDIADVVFGGNPGRWRELLAVLRDQRWWLGYQDPHLVALGLHRRLQSRPRLRLSVADLPAVTTVLTAVRPAVDASTDDIVDIVTRAVRGAG